MVKARVWRAAGEVARGHDGGPLVGEAGDRAAGRKRPMRYPCAEPQRGQQAGRTAASRRSTSLRLSTSGSTRPRFGLTRLNTVHCRPSVTSKRTLIPHRCCRAEEPSRVLRRASRRAARMRLVQPGLQRKTSAASPLNPLLAEAAAPRRVQAWAQSNSALGTARAVSFFW